MKNITTIPSFELSSDHKIARAEMRISRRAKYKIFTSKREGERWIIIPESKIGKENEIPKAKLVGPGKVQEGYRMTK